MPAGRSLGYQGVWRGVRFIRILEIVYAPAAIYQYNALSAPPVMNPSKVLDHFALHTAEFDSVCVATQAFCSKSHTFTRPSIALKPLTMEAE